MVQLAPRFAPLLAFCLLASATPIVQPLDQFVSLNAGVAQPTPHGLNTPGVQHSAVEDKNVKANHTARAVPVSVLADILKDGHENPDTSSVQHSTVVDKNVQANNTARAIPVDILGGGHEQNSYIPGLQDNAVTDKDAQAEPGQGSPRKQPAKASSVQGNDKREEDGQYHPNPAYDDGKYHPNSAYDAGTHTFDDGQYHPNPAYDDGKYHPNSAYDDGKFHGSTMVSATPAANPTPDVNMLASLPSGVQVAPSVVDVLLSTATVTETSETHTASPASAKTTSAMPAAAATTIAVPMLLETTTGAISGIMDAVKVGKRYEDGQYHPDPKFNDGLYHPDAKFNDGLYHPDSKFDDGLYHPDSKFDDGQYHPKRYAQSDDGLYHPDAKFNDGLYHPDSKFDDGLYHPDSKFDDGQYHPKRYDGMHQGKVRTIRRRDM